MKKRFQEILQSTGGKKFRQPLNREKKSTGTKFEEIINNKQNVHFVTRNILKLLKLNSLLDILCKIKLNRVKSNYSQYKHGF